MYGRHVGATVTERQALSDKTHLKTDTQRRAALCGRPSLYGVRTWQRLTSSAVL